MVTGREGRDDNLGVGRVGSVNYWVKDRLKDVLYSTGNLTSIL